MSSTSAATNVQDLHALRAARKYFAASSRLLGDRLGDVVALVPHAVGLDEREVRAEALEGLLVGPHARRAARRPARVAPVRVAAALGREVHQHLGAVGLRAVHEAGDLGDLEVVLVPVERHEVADALDLERLDSSGCRTSWRPGRRFRRGSSPAQGRRRWRTGGAPRGEKVVCAWSSQPTIAARVAAARAKNPPAGGLSWGKLWPPKPSGRTSSPSSGARCPISPASTCSATPRPRHLRRQGQVDPQAGRLPLQLAQQPQHVHRPHRVARRPHRGRGPAHRAELHQAVPAALQHPAARRQVLPVHRDQPRRGLPARVLHARAPPARARLLRALLERQARARHARPARQDLPVPLLRGRRAGAPLRLAVPRLLHQALRGPVRRLRVARRSTARASTA